VNKLALRLLLATALVFAVVLGAAERIPPAPARYFNDYAGVVSASVANELNAELEQFERTSSNQLVVAIYPRMESDSSVSDYTVRVAQSWRVGQKSRDNGAVLFAFMKEHQLYIQVGYGLEAVLPDATAKRIVEQEIVPRFRQNDVDGGMRAAVTAMMAATRGEYQGSGNTRVENQDRRGPSTPSLGFVALLILFVVISSIFRRRSQRTYVFGRPGLSGWMGPSGGGGRSGGWSSGGGGGGGFSGGGGSFGGGGAGGKW